MESAEQLLLAGLARDAADDDDLKERFRAWYRQTMEDHDRTIIRMMKRFAALEEPS